MPDETRPAARDTIFAPATGTGTSAIAIIRISGARAHAVLKALVGGTPPPAGHLKRRWILDAAGDRLDDAMVVRFEGGGSFTGEPMAEVHCHGSRAVFAAISGRLTGDLGCRLARPGEFSRRALEAGRIDLAEAEGLADLIAAETEAQRRQAVRIMSGGLSALVETWRSVILRACALIEVSIDWVDEEIPEDVRPEVRRLLERLIGDLETELARSKASQRIRTGFEVAILGAPNVGKSTLLNCLAGREAAIVSEVPGTTRDVIEIRYDLNGLPVTFLDTAGLRAVDDAIESLGIAMAVDRARAADVRLFLQTPESPAHGIADGILGADDLVVWSKSDLGGRGSGFAISAKTGEGIDALLSRLYDCLGRMMSETGLIAHMRHEEAVSHCHSALAEALSGLDTDAFEITAERLRLGASWLERIVGRIDAEAVLDVVFGTFCLGK